MQCPNCGHEMKEGTRFCTNCGSPLKTSDSDGAAESRSQQAAAAESASQGAQVQASPAGSWIAGYWDFFVRTLKHPISQGKRETNRIYGYISFILASLLLSIGITVWFDHFMSVLQIPDMVQEELHLNFFQVFLILLVDSFLIAVAAFLIVKLVYKNTIDFSSFITKYAGQGTPVLVIAAVAFLIGLTGIQGSFPAFLLFSAIGLLFLPSVTTLFSLDNNGSMDRMYAYLILLAVQSLIQYITIDMAMNAFVEHIGDLLSTMLDLGL